MKFTHADCAQLLAAVDPSWRIREIEPVAAGMLNDVARVHLIGDQPSSVVIRARHFEDSRYGQEFAAERFVYALLPEERPARPHLYGVGRLGLHRAAVFEDIVGPSLDDMLKDTAVSDHEKRGLILQIAEDLAIMHSRPAHGFGTPRTVEYAPDQALAFWSGLFSAEVEALGSIAPQSVPALADAVRGWLGAIEKAPHTLLRPCLVHGDVHGRNVLVRDGRCILIDWEAARFRSPAYDLVQLHTLDLATRPADAALLREAYLSRRGSTCSAETLEGLVRVFTGFWRTRMAIFMVANDRPGCPYFGTLVYWRAFLETGEFN